MQYQFTQDQIERWMGQEAMKVKALEEEVIRLKQRIKTLEDDKAQKNEKE